MLPTMIESHSLTKRYGGRTAVQDVSFSCDAGTVTGFLGPNGAGKSTTLKMLVGLTPPSSGGATVLGSPFANLTNPGRRVGVLIDASAQHAGRTGRETLSVSASLLGVRRGRVDEMLELVGLDRSAAGKRVGQYSLGMRQRLGIAHALLGDPEVLILDEPANGLDPEGMRWMRGLLGDFAERGGTVLLSSHLLHEVEAIADRIVIIAGGRIVGEGTADELLGGGPQTLVRARDLHGLRLALRESNVPFVDGQDGALLVDASADDVGDVALCSRVALSELRNARDGGLEQLFFSLTSTGSERSDRSDAGPGGLSMSAVTTVERELEATPRARVRDDRQPSMARLTRVELRKMFDTRSGFWLPICVGVAAIVTVLITVLTGPDINHTFTHVFGNAVIPTAILLPLIGVLLVTGEFSQRTALTTFTLVPSRARVMIAKLSASVVCSVVALAFCLVVAAGATALHPATDPGVNVWSLHAVLIPQALVYLATAMITGVAFGAALLVSAPAIVIYLLLPTSGRS